MASTSQEHRIRLYDVLLRYFSLAELEDVCFRLGVDWDELPGSTKASKARALVDHLARRNRLEEIARIVSEERSNVAIGWQSDEPKDDITVIQSRYQPILQLEMLSRDRPSGNEVDFGIVVQNTGSDNAEQIALSVADTLHSKVLQTDPVIERLKPGAEIVWRCVLRPLRAGDIPIKVTADFQRPGARTIYTTSHEDMLLLFKAAQRYPYAALDRNPYITGGPVQTDSVFFGRDRLIAEIASDLQGMHQDNVIVLYGQRRTGKTSILYALQRHLPKDRYLSVIFDAQGVDSLPSLFWSLAMSICDACAKAGIVIPEPALADFLGEAKLQFEHGFLRLVKRHLGHRRLLLMIDEFEGLEEAVKSGGLPDTIIPFLRHLMQHEQAVSFIFCGAHQIRELTTQYWQVFFNAALPKLVSFLDEEATLDLIQKPVRNHFAYDALALHRLARLSGGNPFFTQLLCHGLVKYAGEIKCGYITRKEIDDVLRDFVQTGNDHLDYIWRQSSTAERAVLLAVNDEVNAQRKTEAQWQRVIDRLRQLCPSACGTADEARDSLKQRELIAGDEWGVRFTMGIIPEWLAAHRSWASLDKV